METNVRTPLDIFNLPQHLVVPLFQRRYVWSEPDQWLPLWQDVRRLTEIRLNDPYSSATHFLGAVVVQAQENQTGNLPARNVIDGQQRLTTLQLLMDAAGSVLEEAGQDALAGQTEVLTHNLELYVTGGGTRLKLRHTNQDQAAFDQTMNAEPPVDHDALGHSGSLLVQAHKFFVDSIREWLGNDPGDSRYTRRATALVQVLTRGLQLVVIDLQAQENSQEIFETLNARGTPLTAADLVKNFVFQRLDSEGVDIRRAYAEDWPFESNFWESQVSVGRYYISRSSLFLNQWLVSRLGEEISPKSTFARFKHYVDHECGQKMSQLLVSIKEQADLYEQWTRRADDPDRTLSASEMAVYRMKAAGIELLKPVLIWLHEPNSNITAEAADEVTATVESWVMRRMLLRLPSSDLGRVAADVIRTQRTAPVKELPERVRTYLTRLTSASTYWPGDEEVRSSLLTENAYRRFPKSRLRMFLETFEDRKRAKHDYPPMPRRAYPIEHVLPQKWQASWQVKGLEAEIDRAAHVHRLGNLTLLTKSMNSTVSNGCWKAKRDKLATYDVFLMNRHFRDETTEVWDEERIDARSGVMIEALLTTWPVPEGHHGQIVHPTGGEQSWVEIKHLLTAGLLAPGTTVIPRPGQWKATEAIVREDGTLEVGGAVFDTPSGAGKHVKGTATNGWYFWRLEDGRRLADVRAVYRGGKPEVNARPAFDWSRLHTILEALPEGSWTTYTDLADAVGTAPQPLGDHVATCNQCSNAHRVLTHDGRVAEGFAWSDPEDHRDPGQVLRAEGIAFPEGAADPEKHLASDDLTALAQGDELEDV